MGFDDEFSKALGTTLVVLICIFIILLYLGDILTDDDGDACPDSCYTDSTIIRFCIEDASRLCLSKGMILSDIDLDEIGVFAICVSDHGVERYMVYCGKGISDVYGG